MVDKSGGDIAQANGAEQLGMSTQGLNAIGTGGAGVQEALGGSGAAVGAADAALQQAQAQANQAMSGTGGSDNINANTTINIS
jgi:hypothetical protein